MGFGTFFVGYFFLVNISYFVYTDIIGAMLMLLGLYKLSEYSKSFLTGTFFAAAFALFSMAEIGFEIAGIFTGGIGNAITDSIFTALRYALIFGITFSALSGINEVARGVEAYELAKKASKILPFCALYVVFAVCEVSAVSVLLGAALPYVYLVLLTANLVLTTFVLITVHKAFTTICLPSDNNRCAPKKSKFEFVNKFREHEEQKSREYAEYKMQKQAEKQNKKSKKK